MSEYVRPIRGIQDAIWRAFCGSDGAGTAGFSAQMHEVRSLLLSYLDALDPPTGEAPRRVMRGGHDDCTEGPSKALDRCREVIEVQLIAKMTNPPRSMMDASTTRCLAQLIMIPEQLDVAQFSLERLRAQTEFLIDRFNESLTHPDATPRGLSRFAQTEVREICQRLSTITELTKFLLKQDPEGHLDDALIQSLSGQLEEFARIALGRHEDRLNMGECCLVHDRPYRVILDASARLGERMAQVAHHWSAQAREAASESSRAAGRTLTETSTPAERRVR